MAQVQAGMSVNLDDRDFNSFSLNPSCHFAWKRLIQTKCGIAKQPGGFVQVKVNHVAVGSFCPEVILLSQTSTIALGLLAGMQISSAKFPAQLHSARVVRTS